MCFSQQKKSSAFTFQTRDNSVLFASQIKIDTNDMRFVAIRDDTNCVILCFDARDEPMSNCPCGDRCPGMSLQKKHIMFYGDVRCNDYIQNVFTTYQSVIEIKFIDGCPCIACPDCWDCEACIDNAHNEHTINVTYNNIIYSKRIAGAVKYQCYLLIAYNRKKSAFDCNSTRNIIFNIDNINI